MKECSKCKLIKDEKEFYKRKNNQPRADCKACFKKTVRCYSVKHKEKISEHKKTYYECNVDSIKSKRNQVREEKRQIIEAEKQKACNDCGKVFPSCSMDFDHRNRKDKKTGISKILNTRYSVEVLKIELDKCDLVCACCHRNRTYEYGQRNKSSKRKYPARDTKKQIVNELKDTACVDCGNKYHPWQMDFDHVRGIKNFKISDAVVKSTSIEQILEEIQKCDLVCVNCHRVRHSNRRC